MDRSNLTRDLANAHKNVDCFRESMNMNCLQWDHVTHHVICHARIGEWPEATTPASRERKKG